MIVTKAKVDKDIQELEDRLHFLRQLRAYMAGGELSVTATETPVEEESKLPEGRTGRVGVRANLLRKLAEGAAYPAELKTWFRPDQEHVVTNALASLKRDALARDTAKGRIELTTKGLEEAQWFVAHPTLTKRGKRRSNAVR